MRSFPSWPGAALSFGAGLCLVALVFDADAQEIAAPPGDEPLHADREYEALTRGPLHEAFANPYVTNPEPGIVIEEQPPEPIDEVPPESMPEGRDIAWIPGYWGWDPDSGEFLWISGLWREMPAQRRWVPGYWTEVSEGWQWVSGFWTSAETEQLAYLPQPPESLERGPNIQSPEGDYFWIPGCWIWQDVSYDWRPGYWAPAVADWVWVPDQYVWTPYGCVFLPGFWDLTFIERAVAFAPVRFDPVVYRQPAFEYVPSVVIDSAPLLMHLFVSPTYSHYYYGDYYAFQPTHPGFTFYPWASYGRRARYYDPLLTYYQWSYGRRDIDFVNRVSRWNAFFVSNEAYRPPRTFQAQREFLARTEGAELPIRAETLAFGSTLDDFARNRGDRVRFRSLSEPARTQFAERAQSLRGFQEQRREFEVAAAGDADVRGRRDAGDRGVGETPPERTLELPDVTAVTSRGEAARDETGRDAADSERRAPDGVPSGRTELPPSPRPGREPGVGGRPGRDVGERPGAPDREEAGRERPGTLPADERGRGVGPDRGRLDAPGSETPDAPGLDSPDAADRPDAERPVAPEVRPERDRPAGNVDDAPARGRRDETGPTLPRPEGRTPGVDAPGADDDRTPGAGRPRNRAGSAIDRLPGAEPGGAEDEPPQFPRFGTSRGRGARTEGAGGETPRGAGTPGATVPGAGRSPTAPDVSRGRRGVDPFGGPPPRADGAGTPDLRSRRPDANPAPARGALGREALPPRVRDRSAAPRGPSPPPSGQAPAARPNPGGGPPPGAGRPPRGRGEEPRPGAAVPGRAAAAPGGTTAPPAGRRGPAADPGRAATAPSGATAPPAGRSGPAAGPGRPAGAGGPPPGGGPPEREDREKGGGRGSG